MTHSDHHYEEQNAGYTWLAICAVGMISSLTLYGISLEYATSNGHQLHEVSFLFITCFIYSVVSYVAKSVRGEKESPIPKYKMLILSFTSVCSTFTSVRSLRYVIYPVQVLAKSCKPVPVMLFGVVLGKHYPLKKYVHITIITLGVALFMGGGGHSSSSSSSSSSSTMLIGGIFLFLSLCFDGLTGAYEEKLMAVYKIEPFNLMFNIQIGKTMISFLLLVMFNELHVLLQTVHDMGFVLIILGLTGALGQVFVFITISKFGALNCSIIGLVRKMLSLLLSFVIYGHHMNGIQMVGLFLSLSAMVANFKDKTKKKGGGGGGKEEEGGERKEGGQEQSHQEGQEDEEQGLLEGGDAATTKAMEGIEGKVEEFEMTETQPTTKKTELPSSFPEGSYIEQDSTPSPFSKEYKASVEVRADGSVVKK